MSPSLYGFYLATLPIHAGDRVALSVGTIACGVSDDAGRRVPEKIALSEGN